MFNFLRNIFDTRRNANAVALPVELRQSVIDLLSSLPNVHDRQAWKAMLYQGGLDRKLQKLIDVSGPAAQFVPTLVETVSDYGRLADGRDPLIALLEVAQQHVGLDGSAECDRLIAALLAHARAAEEPEFAAGPDTPAATDDVSSDPYWHLKIDRVKQYNSVIAQTRLMLREQKPKSLAFAWYGQEGQGIEIFHKRLLVELREELSSAFVYQVRPRWPEHLANYHDAFSDVLCEAFKAKNLTDIPARIRSESHGVSNKVSVVYVRHEPVRSTRVINPESLKTYIHWWDSTVTPLLAKKQFAVLTASFLVSNPPAFAQYVDDEHIEELDLKRTVFWLLDEMEKIAKRDLLLFLRTHNIDIPGDRKNDVLQHILNSTGGRYERTIEELKKLRRNAWSVGGKIKKTPRAAQKTFDY